MAATKSGNGYWLVAADGSVFTFGDAVAYNNGGPAVNKPIVAMEVTASGKGYWLVASDGSVFSFGDAHSYGGADSVPLNKPIVAMKRTRDGNGYWLVESDGRVLPFGDATEHSYGGAEDMGLTQPIVGMQPTESGDGYWLASANGNVYPFGDAATYGSTGSNTFTSPIVAIDGVPYTPLTVQSLAAVPAGADGGSPSAPPILPLALGVAAILVGAAGFRMFRGRIPIGL
jgi:ribosomal protein L24E